MPFAVIAGMSKHINVNPNFYKVGGREHAEGHGEAVPYEQEKQRLKQAQSERVLPGQKRPAKKK
jgi:hypothetical protein